MHQHYILEKLDYKNQYETMKVLKKKTERYSESSQTSEREIFEGIVNSFNLFTIFTRSCSQLVCLGFKYASENDMLPMFVINITKSTFICPEFPVIRRS